MKRLWNRYKDNILIIQESYRVAGLCVKYYGGFRVRAFLKALRFTWETKMRPMEALEYGAFSSGARQYSDYLSKRTCSVLQSRLNPQDWFWVTEDKGIFQSFCDANKIQTPKCLALLFRNSPGISSGRPVPATKSAWAEVISRLDLDKVVIKPCRHSYGRGLLVPLLREDRIEVNNIKFDSAQELANYMFDLPELTSWIVQERIQSHSALSEFSGTKHLQTMRIYTHVDKRGKIFIIDAFLKVIGGDAAIDNFQHGSLGNFIAPIDIESGQLESAITRSPDMLWYRFDVHPRTKRKFQEFTIPLWEHAKELVIKNAECFKPIRSLGWDVAITEDGPVVIETNMRWDPPNWNPETIYNVRKVLENPDSVFAK
ncbi:Sugar-transfer associated ATP-grasp [Marinobacter sp. es.048]|uniref:sugar-transfer associated ATP-grasp domain-containing protein n=1 Tax=Marinobacter sp. es.048 TaxID=1761795 RepID=UPI000B595AA7|nr:sugar-transfer associated ATP-grasp domain-containing protein [Marinobacter sp. es.048]SNC74369.1 Sugar-transfer associated ATP-grasp [Marinobacter sp. es.048]